MAPGPALASLASRAATARRARPALLVGDFNRPLAPGWERDINDALLRQDIADAANGDPALRLDSAAALAEGSERVRAKFGFACTASAASLDRIELRAATHPPDAEVEVLRPDSIERTLVGKARRVIDHRSR